MKAMKILRYATMLVFVLASIRIITGASDLTSTGTASAALLLSVPIVLAALGGLFSERAGVVNIGLEGMMIMGAWAGGYIGSQHGPWVGLFAAMIFGSVGALVHAIATVTFGVDHVVSGVAINIIAAGLFATYQPCCIKVDHGQGHHNLQELNRSRLMDCQYFLEVNTLAGRALILLGSIANLNWFFISDTASILRGLTGDVSYVTVVAISFVPLAYFILWRTAFGLRLRSAGEAPVAAESLGVNVYAMKYAGVLISGGFAGLGGGFLAIVAASNYQENQVAGRGYIGLAALLFGNYRPGGLLAGAGLFGFADALQLRDSAAIHALLLFIVAILAFVAFRKFKAGKQLGAILSLAAAGFTLWFYFAVDELPGQLVTMTPYIATILVMALASQRLRMPAADGIPYRRGGLR